MIEPRIDAAPRTFSLEGFQVIDHGSIRFFPEAEATNEILAFENASGKKCELAATSWGYYLGPSLNSRLVDSGYRAALTVNHKNQIYLMAVDKEKMHLFEQYMSKQANSRVICWLDEWLKA